MPATINAEIEWFWEWILVGWSVVTAVFIVHALLFSAFLISKIDLIDKNSNAENLIMLSCIMSKNT